MFSDGFEMLEQTFLGWTVVVWRYRQATHDTRIVEALGQADGFSGRVGTRTRNDRDTPVCQFEGQHDHFAMLFMAQRCRFTGSPYRNNRRGSAGDMIINQFLQA